MKRLITILVLAVVGVLGLLAYLSREQLFRLGQRLSGDTYEVEHTDYHPPKPDDADGLTDDRLEEKHPPAFDPTLVDRRPLGQGGAWLLNASAAMLRLDVPM